MKVVLETRRVRHHQSARWHTYCIERDHHVTIIDPPNPYSGDEHKLGFSECDCEAKSPSTPEGEAEGNGEQAQSYGGTDSDSPDTIP